MPLVEYTDKQYKEDYEAGIRGGLADIHEAYKRVVAREAKAKKAKSKTKGELINLKKDVKGTYISKKDYSDELGYMKDKLNEIESKIKGSKKSDKSDTVKDLKKLYKKVKDTKMVSSFKPELDSMKEKLKEINSLMKKPKKQH